MANILLGVSGGIAAYKALELVRLATAAGHSVRVLQTRASRRFVGAASFAALTGAPALCSEFERDPAHGCFPGEPALGHDPIAHLELPAKADVYLIAPASANTIARLAHGLTGDIVASAALVARCPLLIAPAMNERMYEHPATQANLQLLRARGATVLEPGSGRLASAGEQGVGRLQEPHALLDACEAAIAGGAGVSSSVERPPSTGGVVSALDGQHSWQGLSVLVTAGGTREPIDGVRFIGNSSSGRMGLALAQAAAARGARVHVLGANVTLPHPPGVKWSEAPTAEEMRAACERELAGADVLLMAAAVADFRPVSALDGKIKKDGRQRLSLELEPTADILSGLAARRSAGQTLVGFAAEHGGQQVGEARRKLRDKGLDAVVFNDISRSDIGFDSQSNEVTIVAEDFEVTVEKAPKEQIAEAILDAVQRLRTRTPSVRR